MSSTLVRTCVALVAAAGIAGVASRSLVPTRAEAAVPRPIAPAVAALAVRGAEAPPDCVRAFSKDFCDGVMVQGSGVETECQTGTQPCHTIRVTQATFDVPLQPNYTACSEGRCDESPSSLDRMKCVVDWTMRLQDPCPFRACWEGTGQVRKDGGGSLTYTGTIMGTMGAGTHRDFVCPKYRTGFCERCLDVEFIASEHLWRIGFEASFHGTRSDQLTGEEVCFSISGDFYASGDEHGPYDLTGGWAAYGTCDGIWLTQCQ
jgi:hypothetical protein